MTKSYIILNKIYIFTKTFGQIGYFNSYSSKKFKYSCKKIAKGLADDLQQHVLLILLETDLTNVVNIENYATSIAYSEFCNRKSKFNKQLGVIESNDLTGIEVAEQPFNIDEQHSIVIKIINKEYFKSIRENRFPVGHELFKKKLELKTIRAVADYFNMAKSTVHDHIRDYKKSININYESTN